MVDVRHEQSAVFAAEATGKLTRTPGLAVLTAGPGVTNGVSALVQAQHSGVPLVTLGGRAPNGRWGQGALQELDHPELLRPVTKLARTIPHLHEITTGMHEAFTVASRPHRGPVFVDIPMDQLYGRTEVTSVPPVAADEPAPPDPDQVAEVAGLLAAAEHPLLILGSDVWMGGAEREAVRLAEEIGAPVVTNGMARGILPATHPVNATRARRSAVRSADLVVVIGTPLDFRVGYGSFGESGSARVVHIVDAPDQVAGHVALAMSLTGDLRLVLDALATAWQQVLRRPDWSSWTERLTGEAEAARAGDAELLASDADPIHPARIYGELLPLLEPDAVVIGDGGDFVSFAGLYVQPSRPGCWLDPGPYGCLGAGLGAAIGARIARPDSQVVLLLGDGAAGMSLLDVDTLVRHRLPVVMVVGNNGGWGLERSSMRMLYGYSVADELSPGASYDGVVRALGGAGESVTSPDQIGPALRRAFDSGVPYLVNVACDPAAEYPRVTFGV